jgi:hypothetical protein
MSTTVNIESYKLTATKNLGDSKNDEGSLRPKV